MCCTDRVAVEDRLGEPFHDPERGSLDPSDPGAGGLVVRRVSERGRAHLCSLERDFVRFRPRQRRAVRRVFSSSLQTTTRIGFKLCAWYVAARWDRKSSANLSRSRSRSWSWRRDESDEALGGVGARLSSRNAARLDHGGGARGREKEREQRRRGASDSVVSSSSKNREVFLPGAAPGTAEHMRQSG